MNRNSKYIVFEGTDGSGKTTIAKAVYDALPGDKLFTKEPGSPLSDFCIAVRRLILDGSGEDIDPITYAYLFAADTYEHQTKIVIPALKEGKWVVSDRSVLSDFAYRPDTGDHIRFHNYQRFLSLNPRVFWIDATPSVCEHRMLAVRDEPLNEFEKAHVRGKLDKLHGAYYRAFNEDRKVPAGDFRSWHHVPNNHDLQSAIGTVKDFLSMLFEELREGF